MALIVPDLGEQELLDKAIKDALSVDENYQLRLYTAVSPALGESTVTAHFTQATFTGYAQITLTRASAAAASTAAGVTSTSWAQQSWTNSGSAQTILGYYVVGATSGVTLWAEEFAASRTLNTGDSLQLTPRLELA